MRIKTESGSVYEAVPTDKGLLVSKPGQSPQVAVAVRPALLPNVLATVRVERDGPYHCGYNAQGGRILRIIPDQVMPGMILANRRGLRSTPIVEVVT